MIINSNTQINSLQYIFLNIDSYIYCSRRAKEDREDTGTIMGNNESQKKNRKRNKEYRYISIDKA